MRYVGIDPGKKAGGIGVLDGLGRAIEVLPMPMVVAAKKAGKKKGRDQYDLQEIKQVLTRQAIESGGSVLFVIEKMQALPASMGGAWTNFARGTAMVFEGILVGLGLPYQLVAPRSWQKVMHEGTPGEDTKQRSIMAAKRLWPAVSLKRTPTSRKDDDGLAEALLVAEYGRRRRNGIEDDDEDGQEGGPLEENDA